MSSQVAEIDADSDPADETLSERRMRALTLRNARATFTQIAERLSISPAQARKDVLAAKRSIIDESTREHLIAEQQAVIYDVRQAFYLAMGAGDVDAAKVVLSTLQHQRDLWGLDAPKRVNVGIGTDVEFAHDLVSLIESIGHTAPADLVFAARGERTAVGGGAADERAALAAGEARDENVIDAEWSNVESS